MIQEEASSEVLNPHDLEAVNAVIVFKDSPMPSRNMDKERRNLECKPE